MHAARVNPAAVHHREAGILVGKPPFVLGSDVSGTVESVGLGVTRYRPGDEVFGMLPCPHGHGACAQYALGPARVLQAQQAAPDNVRTIAGPDGADHQEGRTDDRPP